MIVIRIISQWSIGGTIGFICPNKVISKAENIIKLYLDFKANHLFPKEGRLMQINWRD